MHVHAHCAVLQAQRRTAAEDRMLREQRMEAAEHAMRAIFRGTVARSFAPAAAQLPGSFQRGGGSAPGRLPPQQQQRRLHAAFAGSGGQHGGPPVHAPHAPPPARDWTYQQQGGGALCHAAAQALFTRLAESRDGWLYAADSQQLELQGSCSAFARGMVASC